LYTFNSKTIAIKTVHHCKSLNSQKKTFLLSNLYVSDNLADIAANAVIFSNCFVKSKKVETCRKHVGNIVFSKKP